MMCGTYLAAPRCTPTWQVPNFYPTLTLYAHLGDEYLAVRSEEWCYGYIMILVSIGTGRRGHTAGCWVSVTPPVAFSPEMMFVILTSYDCFHYRVNVCISKLFHIATH